MPRKARPGVSDEREENRIAALAQREAERRIKEGKASDALLLHYLRNGSTTNQLRKEKLENENTLLKAKTSAIESTKETESLYRDAIKAFTSYTVPEDDEE